VLLEHMWKVRCEGSSASNQLFYVHLCAPAIVLLLSI
jgi:hypothetical protein